MTPPLACSRCKAPVTLGRGEGYLVEIKAVADPSPPVFTGDDLSVDADREISRLVARLHAWSPRQIADQVYRRSFHCLCNACYVEWSNDPFGTRT